MRTDIDKEFIRNIAMHVPKREYIFYIFSMASTKGIRQKMIKYMSSHTSLTEQDITTKVLELQKSENVLVD